MKILRLIPLVVLSLFLCASNLGADIFGPTQDAQDIDIKDAGGYFTGTDVETALQEIGAGGGTAAAPNSGDYLVGTANGSLSAEIVVGTTPNGDLGGTWDNISVDDDSHNHTTTTISGLDISADTNLTAGDALTLTDDDLDFDGGASPGGELGGTWASPTIDDSVAVSSWSLTTPTIIGNAVFNNANTSAGSLSIYEDTDDGSNYTKFQVVAQVGDITYSLPPDDGDAGEQLQTNGSGTLTWEAAGAGAGTAWDDIADPDADTTIAMGGYESTFTSTLDEANHVVLKIDNTDADLANDTYLQVLEFTDDGDANGLFFDCRDNNGDSKFKIGADGATNSGALTSTGTVTSSGTFDVTGATGLVLGSADVTGFTVTTDGTGNAEFTLPNDVIGDADIDWGTGAGQVGLADIGAASTALDNLASVAINTSLISDTDNTDDLGSSAKAWKDLYLDGGIVGLDGTMNPTNLLSNGDFENWTAGISGDGWLSSTVLVCNFDGADAQTSFTAATGQEATFAGTAQLDTAQKKFGSASLLLDGDSDYVTFPDNASWTFGTGNFTIEFWLKINSGYAGSHGIWGQFEDGTHQSQIKVSNGAINFYWYITDAYLADYTTAAGAFPDDSAWHHVAIVRSSTTGYCFVDGVSKTFTASTAFGTNDLTDIAAVLNIGMIANNYTNGWIDEVHIYKGVAKYTANFTPETAALTTDDWNAPDGWGFSGVTGAREGTIKKLGTYSAKLTAGGSAGILYRLDYATGAGSQGLAYWGSRTVTLGSWVYATGASEARIAIYDGSTYSYSSYHSGGGSWEWLSVTKTMQATPTQFDINLWVAANKTAYFDGAMLVEGESAFAFADKPLPRGGTITAETDETKFSHKIPVYIDGTLYYIMLTAT